MPRGINSHVLTGESPFINNGLQALLKHGFVTLTMSCQGQQVNSPFEKTAYVRNKNRSL